MKPNDKFEETIRQKLAQIQPQFQDKDWSRFRAYQHLHVPAPSFLGQFGSTLMYSAAGLVATVLVVTNFYQYRQNQQLDAKVAQLQTQIAQQKDKPAQIVTRVDTVLVNRYIAIKETTNPQPTVAFAQPLPSSAAHDAVAQQLSRDNAALAEERLVEAESVVGSQQLAVNSKQSAVGSKQLTVGREQSAVDREQLAGNNKQLTVNSKQLTVNSKQLTVNSKQLTVNSKQLTVNSNPSPVGSESGEDSPPLTALAGEANSSEIALEPLTPHLQYTALTGIEYAEPQVKRYAHLSMLSQNAATKERKTLAPPPPSLSFKNVKFRLGAGASMGDKYTGYSLHSSVLLGRYWSVDVGLKKVQLDGPQYFTEDLFKKEVKKDFDDWRKAQKNVKPPMIPPQILNIQTNVEVVRLPVTLTYRWPLREGFTILAFGGTNFNLSAVQNYTYQIRTKINGEFEQERGDFDIKPALSNDVMLGFGLEKQWKNLVAQLETYTAPYLAKPVYLTDNRNIGVRFKLMYQFGKN
ncbi:MAG: hypothetical protein MUE30_08710 [Spirosomaceae bacterium]|nr:hypothetical protein [Spirosomataceae bacterium]